MCKRNHLNTRIEVGESLISPFSIHFYRCPSFGMVEHHSKTKRKMGSAGAPHPVHQSTSVSTVGIRYSIDYGRSTIDRFQHTRTNATQTMQNSADEETDNPTQHTGTTTQNSSETPPPSIDSAPSKPRPFCRGKHETEHE